MKKAFIPILLLVAVLLTSCSNTPKKVASQFMKSMVSHNYDEAAASCGFSKDPASRDLVITVLLEQFGDDIRAFTVTNDSLLPDKERAIVTMTLSYNNDTKEEDYPIYMKKMDDKWYVDPFTIVE